MRKGRHKRGDFTQARALETKASRAERITSGSMKALYKKMSMKTLFCVITQSDKSANAATKGKPKTLAQRKKAKRFTDSQVYVALYRSCVWVNTEPKLNEKIAINDNKQILRPSFRLS